MFKKTSFNITDTREANYSRTCSLKQNCELKVSQLSVTTNPQNEDRAGLSNIYCLCGKGESGEMITVITLAAPSCGSLWSALEWRRPQRGSVVYAKVCIYGLLTKREVKMDKQRALWNFTFS